MKTAIIFLSTALIISFVVGITSTKMAWDSGYNAGHVDGYFEGENINKISLEDRFANLLEAFSDNNTMLYNSEIKAHLNDQDEPDSIDIILYFNKGESIMKGGD